MRSTLVPNCKGLCTHTHLGMCTRADHCRSETVSSVEVTGWKRQWSVLSWCWVSPKYSKHWGATHYMVRERAIMPEEAMNGYRKGRVNTLGDVGRQSLNAKATGTMWSLLLGCCHYQWDNWVHTLNWRKWGKEQETDTCTRIPVHTHLCAHTHTYIYVHTHTHLCAQCTHTPMHTHTYVHTHTHTYVHSAHTHPCAYRCTQVNCVFDIWQLTLSDTHKWQEDQVVLQHWEWFGNILYSALHLSFLYPYSTSSPLSLPFNLLTREHSLLHN